MNRHALEILRYGINGILATAVHYAVLTFCLNQLSIPSAGLANFVSAFFGITTSFFGSRYFVFCNKGEGILAQSTKFGVLYGAIAVLHGLALLLWTDFWGYDYRLGFLLASMIQMTFSYFGNKFLVFK